MSSVDVLFAPFTSRNLALENRIVMAPMTRSFSPGGVPGDNVAAYYRRRAEGGTGLIITEGTSPEHPAAASDPNVPLFYGPALDGWRKVAAAVHGAGAKIMPQLWHVGGLRKPGQGHYPDARSAMPSGLTHTGKQVAEPLSDGEIGDLVAGYARSARYAKDLGFDGVELHGAHGYLIDQFFWDKTNQRSDKWGGDMVERTAFAAAVVQAVRAAVGPAFPILLRFSQWKQQDYEARLAPTPKDLEAFLTPMAAAGVDIFHCSTRRYWDAEFGGSPLNLAGWTKKLTGLPSITVGSVGLTQDFASTYGATGSIEGADVTPLLERLAAREFDLVAVGRMLIVEPEWPKKVRAGMTDMKPYSRETLKVLA